MPYGMKGGDTPESTAWMERCVKSTMADNPDYDKARAIAICKSAHQKKNAKRRRD